MTSDEAFSEFWSSFIEKNGRSPGAGASWDAALEWAKGERENAVAQAVAETVEFCARVAEDVSDGHHMPIVREAAHAIRRASPHPNLLERERLDARLKDAYTIHAMFCEADCTDEQCCIAKHVSDLELRLQEASKPSRIGELARAECEEGLYTIPDDLVEEASPKEVKHGVE